MVRFPDSDVVTNLSTAALIQSFSVISNSINGMTNYFDTVRVDIVTGASQNNVLLTTGDMQMADIHNRRLIEATNSTGVYFWMEPYRTNAVGTGSFGSYLTNSYLSAQSNCVSLGGNTSFGIKIMYSHHRFAYCLNGYLGVEEVVQ